MAHCRSVVDGPMDVDMLYGPSYYPNVDSSGTQTSSSFGSQKHLRAGSSSLRQQVPYLQDLRMSRELVVYQPASAVSAHQASQMVRMMTLGVKLTTTTATNAASGSNGSKPLSFAVPQVHSAIADWDDGSLHRRTSGVVGVPPLLVGGKPLPSISVSCEEGTCARNFYELKQHREGWDASSNGGVEEDSILSIPQWPERAATPEEIAVERQFAEEAPHWHDVYWQRVTAVRKKEELQSQLEQQQQRRAAMGAAPTSGTMVQGQRSVGAVSDVAFSRSASIASSVTGAQSIATPSLPSSAARGAMMHAMMHRKPSMPVLHRMSSGAAGSSSGLREVTSTPTGTSPQNQPRLSFPRWNGSQKLDNHFRREASISSVSSSVLEHASSQCSSTKGSLRELRRSSVTQGSGPAATKQRRGSGAAAGAFLRSTKSSTGGEKVGFSVDGSIQGRGGGSSLCGSVAPNDRTSGSGGSPTPPTVAPFARETIAEKRVQALRRSLSPPIRGISATPGTAPTESEMDELTATDDHVQFVSAHHLLSSTVSTIEQSDLMRSASATPITKPMQDEDMASSLTHRNSSGTLATDASAAVLSGSGTAGRTRPPIPWSSEWSLPIACHVRRLPVATTGANSAWDDASTASEECRSSASSTPSITIAAEAPQQHEDDDPGHMSPSAISSVHAVHGDGGDPNPACDDPASCSRGESCAPVDHPETRAPSEQQQTLSPSPLRQGTNASLLDSHTDPGTEVARDDADSPPSSSSHLNRTNGHNPRCDDRAAAEAGSSPATTYAKPVVAASSAVSVTATQPSTKAALRQPPPPPPSRGEKLRKEQPKTACCNVM